MPEVQKTFKEVFLRDDITEKEALENTPNPGGGKSGGEPEKKSEASEYAKAYSAKMCPENKPADDNAPVNI